MLHAMASSRIGWSMTALAALLLAGCGGGGADAAARPIPNQGASFSWVSGGGSGGAYELPANPPAIEDEHRSRTCAPGQLFQPVAIIGVGEDPGRPLAVSRATPLATLDDWRPIGTDRRPGPTALVTVEHEGESLVPRTPIRPLGASDPRPSTVTGSVLDERPEPTVGAYRQDEEWWCDPSGQRHLR
jgi:hypothetical protein